MASDSGLIRLGLIGLGSWARRAYLPVLQELANVRVEAVAARTEGTRQAAHGLLGGDIDLYGDYSDLLSHARVGAVMIALPPAVSAQATAAALEAGKHVWVEPPFPDDREANRFLDLAERTATVFHVDLQLRYLPAVVALREAVSRGELGRLLQVRVEFETDWARRRPITDQRYVGSPMYGLAPWYIDLLNNFLEGSPERLDVFGSFPRSTSRMEMGTATLQYPGGAVGEWAFSLYTANEMELRLKIVGTDGEAEVNLMSGAYRRRSRDGEWQSAVADCSRPVYGFVGMRESVAAFLSAIEAGGGTRSGPATYRRLQPVLSSLGRSERERWSVRPATR